MTVKTFKLVLLGDTDVGKTSIVQRCQNNRFENTHNTITAAFFNKVIIINGTEIRLQIWDTAGQERFASVAPMYYRSADVCLVIYDVSCVSSLEKAKKWVDEVKKQSIKSQRICFIGNKCDLESKVKADEIQMYCTTQKLSYTICSAKTGEGIDDLFLNLATTLAEIDGAQEQNDTKKVQNETGTENKSCC